MAAMRPSRMPIAVKAVTTATEPGAPDRDVECVGHVLVLPNVSFRRLKVQHGFQINGLSLAAVFTRPYKN